MFRWSPSTPDGLGWPVGDGHRREIACGIVKYKQHFEMRPPHRLHAVPFPRVRPEYRAGAARQASSARGNRQPGAEWGTAGQYAGVLPGSRRVTNADCPDGRDESSWKRALAWCINSSSVCFLGVLFIRGAYPRVMATHGPSRDDIVSCDPFRCRHDASVVVTRSGVATTLVSCDAFKCHTTWST